MLEAIELLDLNSTDAQIVALKAYIDNAIDALHSAVINEVHPVGSVYITIGSENPSETFGGVWEQIKDTFLLAAGDVYSLNSSGGESEHILTVDEMPSHYHNVIFDDGRLIGKSQGTAGSFESCYPPNAFVNGGRSNTALTQYTGNSQPHNNMPPYLAVSIWKRIS